MTVLFATVTAPVHFLGTHPAVAVLGVSVEIAAIATVATIRRIRRAR